MGEKGVCWADADEEELACAATAPANSERTPASVCRLTTFNMIMWNIKKSVWNVWNIKKVSGLDARLRAQALIPQPVLEVVYSVAQRCLGDVLQAS